MHNKVLLDFLRSQDAERYSWEVDCTEVYLGPALCNDGLEDGTYERDELIQLLEKDSYIFFIRIMRYPKGAESFDIDTYEDFLNDNATLVWLCVDGSYIGIYTKDESEAHRLFAMYEGVEHDFLEYVTDENDGRTRLYF